MNVAIYKSAHPYSGDVLNLPVKSLNDAMPFYETVMGFHVISRDESPCKTAILGRDGIRIGLAENGGDPTQNGCFFEVDDVENAFAELRSRGLSREDAGYRIDRHGNNSWRVAVDSQLLYSYYAATGENLSEATVFSSSRATTQLAEVRG